MKDWAPWFRDRAGRRHSDSSGLWYFACGFGWAMVIFIVVDAI